MFAAINTFLSGRVTAGQQAYTTPGTYSWTCPADVYSVSVVAVGGASRCGAGLAYKNNITVTPGNTYTVVVGAGAKAPTSGGDSSFSWSGNTLTAVGGGASVNTGGYPSGTYDGGGNGGNAASTGGGGGAGGYAGNGGTSILPSGGGTAGTGGAGGGGGPGYGGGLGGGGGGVGILGQGADGAGASNDGNKGFGGSGGSDGAVAGASGVGGGGGAYGGGYGFGGSTGAGGAVRIIWPGTSRQFPSTNTGNVT